MTSYSCSVRAPGTPKKREREGLVLQLVEEFGCKAGYSDHTQTKEAALAAVALGAVVIEKHLDARHVYGRSRPQFQLRPRGFAEYVSS